MLPTSTRSNANKEHQQMYLQNKYTQCYYRIISRAKARILPNSVYTENHHIIPKSLGGDNSKNNLVKLTAKEHFICHLLLTKMTNSKNVIYAAWKMSNQVNEFQERYKINANTYEILRKKFSNIHRNHKQSDEARKKNSEWHKGRPATTGMTGKKHSEETKAKMKIARAKQVITEETKRKLSDYNKGKPGTFTGKKHSEEARAKMRLAQQRRRNYIDASSHK